MSPVGPHINDDKREDYETDANSHEPVVPPGEWQRPRKFLLYVSFGGVLEDAWRVRMAKRDAEAVRQLGFPEIRRNRE